ncbi:MAG: DUF885 family protein [Sporomusaceae bacterium]|nr:DUF885 family protein [Sporomusaceae bacterium]
MVYDQTIQQFHDFFSVDPNACVTLGLNKRLNDLPDPSAAAERSQLAEGRLLLENLRHCPRQGLDFDQSLDIDLAIQAVEYALFKLTCRFNDHTTAEQMPDAGDGISDGIFLLFANDPRPAAERLDNITARLEKAPDYLDAVLSRLETPVARWVDMDLEKTAELPAFFDSLRQWAAAEDYHGRQRLDAAAADAIRALDRYRRQLQMLPATREFAIGQVQAAELVRLRGIDLPLGELKTMATDFLAVNRDEVEELRQRLLAKYRLPADWEALRLQSFLNERYRVDPLDRDYSGILNRYQAERESIAAFIREHDLFPLPSGQEMKIIRTPGFMVPSIPAGAMMSPPPFREGIKQSMIYLTLSQELLDEHTELSIPVMLIHEGIPGHHLQLAAAAGHRSVVRRHLDAMDQAEGWTTMLEDYMLDRGYMGDLTDEARFIAKRDIARLGARVAIDLYFMTGDAGYLDVGVPVGEPGGDAFANAAALLSAVTGFTAERLQGELNWYSQSRGYPLSYLAGNRLVWQLKRDVEAAQRGKLSGLALDRAFHRAYLAAGGMPLTFLRKVFAHQGLL